MCGLAGRFLMELGYHNGEYMRTRATSDREREQSALLQATIMVFNRHWSAAIRMPINFQVVDFDQIPRDTVRYLDTPFRTPHLARIGWASVFPKLTNN